MSDASRKDEWISAAVAARIADLDKGAIARLGEAGLIGVRRFPPESGIIPRYFRPDVEAIARASVRRATRGPALACAST
jgi:hypothetical protein